MDSDLEVPAVEFAFDLPDGSIRSATLADDEVRELVGSEHEYTMPWWVGGAERKLAIWQALAALVHGSNAKDAGPVTRSGFNVASACKVLTPTGGIPRFHVTYRFPGAN
jgi:hypothetical protein